jgi:hypothetical protein
MTYATSPRCCRSVPRCRRCPVLLAAELRGLRSLDRSPAEAGLPPHLAGVPACLHRYEPLLRRAWEERQATTGS